MFWGYEARLVMRADVLERESDDRLRYEDTIMKVGEYFIHNGLITQSQLDEALSLQKDNPERALGEILVTLGVFSKEQLIMAMEMYMVETGATPSVVDEWLDQDEVDVLLERIAK